MTGSLSCIRERSGEISSGEALEDADPETVEPVCVMSSTVDGGDISVDGVDADPLEIDSP